MKNIQSQKNSKKPLPVNRLELASKSIAENIEKAKNAFYKNPQYCEHCSKLNDSAVTFKPDEHPTDRLMRSRVLNIRVDPYSSSFPGILEVQNLRLIELNQKCQQEKEDLIQTVNKLVAQCKVYVESYDSNRAVIGLDNIVRAVGGNVMVGYISEQKPDEEWRSLESEKIKNQYLQKSIETLKLIIEKNSDYFPLTKATLIQKYYLSFEDFQQDVNNMSAKKIDDSNLLQLFKLRVADFLSEIENNREGRKMGLCEQQFDRLRIIIRNLKATIEEKQQQQKRYQASIIEQLSQQKPDSEEKTTYDQDVYFMLLNQGLVIEQFLSQQNDE